MRVGLVGAGKLGLPIGLVAASRGHDVVAYDPSPVPAQILGTRIYPYREIGAQELLEATTLRLADSIAQVVTESDLILCIVQTPHGPAFEGASRLPADRRDFDYSYLRDAVASICSAAASQSKRVVLAVMSTVLPGTVDREVRPLLNEYTPLVYAPAFPAMGTAIDDFINPEAFLLGVDDAGAAEVMREFYRTINPTAEVVTMSVASAELTKVSYNTWLTNKLQTANAIGQVSHLVGANVDDVMRFLGKATNRLISTKYMRPGMGDGGGCHPRDLIAMSWLARELGIDYDLYGFLGEVREKQTAWLAGMVEKYATAGHLPVVILGKAFKAGTNLTTGSPATLLREILIETYPADQVSWWDPYIDPARTFAEPAVFFVATCHDDFYGLTYPAGSVVIDPWGRMTDRDGVSVIRVGRDAPREAA